MATESLRDRRRPMLRAGAVGWLVVSGAGLASQAQAQPCTVTPHESWKNDIDFGTDPFRVYGSTAANPDWVKFTILLCDDQTVYYQNSNTYPFHYHFATERLDPLLGLTLQQFNDVTLYEVGQEAVLGAVLMPASGGWPPAPPIQEFGVQLVRQDPYTPDEVIEYFNLVKDSVNADPGVQAFYFPTYEQLGTALEHEAYLAANGVIVSSTARWAQGNAIYSPGWALGTLQFVEGDEIEDAYLSGLLGPDDIVLTDGVPAEMPYLQGILTLSPSTPNSHVAILANSFNIPFVHLALPEDAAHAQSLVGHRVIVTGYENGGGFFLGQSEVRIHDIEGVLSEEAIAELLALKALPPLNLQPMQTFGAISANTENLTLGDIAFFGGKASNYGFLRRNIPDNCEKGAGLSFDLWNAYLDQTISATGNTLRQDIQNRLGGYIWPPDFQNLADDLDDVRTWFRNANYSQFTPAQQSAIIAVLMDPQYDFDPFRKIRFRSSTNVEDSDQFTGAGLYESFSGCLADDLDGDTVGPSHCEPEEPDERGVFRAIKRVYGSFYNQNAFIERLRWGVDESEVGMAVLVHHSYPDEIEMANGVATHRRSTFSHDGLMVTQLGAVSVANPEGGALPEEVQYSVSTWGFYGDILRYSTLTQLGHTVMTWDDDYELLANLMRIVADDYAVTIGQSQFLLDYEYKRVAPEGRLDVKQVRKIPEPDTTPNIEPFLINDPTEYCTYQGEQYSENSDVFANHRLKSRWGLSTKNLWLNTENLDETIYDHVSLELTDGCFTRTIEGPLAGFPNASYHYDEDLTLAEDGFILADLPNGRRYTIVTEQLGELVSKAESPVVTLGDIGSPVGFFHLDSALLVQASYDDSVPYWDWQAGITTRDTDSMVIGPCIQPASDDLLQHREYEGEDGVEIDTTFYWPFGTAPAGYTAPLSHWVETRIKGLTTEEIVLHGWYSQTYKPDHHNFGEHFIFEPRLEPGMSPVILAELEAMDIAYIYLRWSSWPTGPTTYYLDGDGCESVICHDNSDCGYPGFGYYCERPVGQCTGAGICSIMPGGCPRVWDPVCGCDGQTYGNACEAASAGVSVAHEGECPQICGGIQGLACDKGEFCKTAEGECCCDFFGVCTTAPDACPRVIDYVCGCDGQTYLNECEADRAMVSIDHHGPCTVIGACCYPDGSCAVVPQDMCERNCGTFHGANSRCLGILTPFDILTAGVSANPKPVEGELSPTPIRYVRCRPQARGACCTDDEGTCTETYRCWCEQDGGVYQGNGSTCDTVECPWDGRCCVEGACLEDVSEAECQELCGLWSNLFTCSEVACGLLLPGGCCLDGECHSPMSQYYCECQGGTYLGDFFECLEDEDLDCTTLQVCGGFAGIECPDGYFCELPDGKCCCDFTGYCKAIPGGCPLDVWDPVCGCDGVTYAYDCFADLAGVSIDYHGECERDD
jgi:hypothetical protein